PQFNSVLKRDTLLLAMAYARNGTLFPSGVGGAECLLSSNRILSFLLACSALDKARRVLVVHSDIIGKRCSTVSMISGSPPSSESRLIVTARTSSSGEIMMRAGGSGPMAIAHRTIKIRAITPARKTNRLWKMRMLMAGPPIIRFSLRNLARLRRNGEFVFE